jgi:pimeloyl-ACP methyl ester carboxylesterase
MIIFVSAVNAAVRLVDCQNRIQNTKQMNSSTENNTATSANQNSAVQQATVKGEYASLGDLKMYYEIHGTGRPLVLLHGAFMSATVYPALAEGRQVIAVDLQGHGRTADIDRRFTFEQMADDVAALLKQLKIDQTDVFGYSLGGKVGLALAIRHPELVRRLAIYGASYKSFEESLPPDLLEVFKQVTPETFAPKDLKESYEKMSPAPNWIGLAAKILESMKGFQGFSPEQMKAIKAEVFLSAGDHKDVNLEHIVEMHKLIPKSQLAVFPNTEHVVMMTNPDKVLVGVKEFLDNGFETAAETKQIKI